MDVAWEMFLLKVFYGILALVAILTFAAYAVLAERKVSAWIQGRVGPNRTTLPIVGDIPILGPFLRSLGLFQPMADGLKFLFKEEMCPGQVNRFHYHLAPILALIPALSVLAVVPFGQYVASTGADPIPLVLADLDIGILLIFALSSLGVYGIVLAGWASNSKYPFLGGVRASAQMISFELAMGLSVLPVFLWVNEPGSIGGLNLARVVDWQDNGWWMIFVQPVSALVFLVALFAESNRLPFDMPESETDLVGGFHTEYGAFKFGLFFTAEYAHVIVGSAIFALLFLGGWHFLPGVEDPWPIGWSGAALSFLWFALKTFAMSFLFIWVRWTLPRFRYDQVMKLGWGKLLPLALGNLLLYAVLASWMG
jgi:NADH-quinone oxidoreductase subunit H|tara:strand:- start:2822 stop:3922 length:1101 start_codon:yes stop_codon:yes gene_type:complete